MATNFTKGAALWDCGLSMDFFSEGKGDFLKRFGWFINEDTELCFEANRVMIDSLLEFANNYKDKADINTIYKLFGEMLETRLYCASGSLDDSI